MMRAGTEKCSLSRDNRGATIVIVLVAMTFVAILGAVLLYMSLVNIQMKKTDRDGKRNFYSAEAVMNEIRAGMQEAASHAISDAYTDYLINYNTSFAVEEQTEADAKTERFLTIFDSALKRYEHKGEQLFTVSAETAQYNAAALKTFLTSTDGVEVFGNITGDAAHGTVTGDGTGVTLHGIKVTYTKNGYETTIQSDIKISVPPLEDAGSTVMTQVVLPDYALVANVSLNQGEGTGGVTVKGNAYAGEVRLDGSGNIFTVDNADYFISKGNVTLTGGTSNFSNSYIWANGINIFNGGELHFGGASAGDLNVLNDLQLAGTGSKAYLSGRYFGFGNTEYADQSSSIIINGKDTTLNMAGLRALTLAGHSFINVDGSNDDILMGESVSVKTNQLAYLVPRACLRDPADPAKAITNPMMFETDPSNEVLKTYIDYGQKILGEKTLGQYVSEVAFVHYPKAGEGTLVYFYLKFTGTGSTSASDKANAYFKDYFEAYEEEITKYLEIYADEIKIGSNANSLAGHAVTYSQDIVNLITATGASKEIMTTLKNRYARLYVTLSPNGNPDGCTTPYQYYIGSTALPAFDDSVPGVIVTNSSYTVNNGDGISLVIAAGDVAVNDDFNGLIISGGSVRMGANVTVTANRAAVNDALDALKASGVWYFDPKHFPPTGGSGGGGGSQDGRWDMENLVTYENWTKN